ncbi:Aflatoxin B1 aldehyde reductase member 4 [Leucoagaricus sp. SymC.cos]|nr:Aflatoxin B1 aldehyde reductase member 4 [Leucoagaricus sp. SymC.cos]
MTFGEAGKEQAQVHDLKDIATILNVFKSHGYTEIDTARAYGEGTSEKLMGQLDLENKGFKIETKLYPTVVIPNYRDGVTHSPEDLKKHLRISLEALNVKSLEVWYLHGPDRSVPYEVTLKAVNDLYKEGYFKRFGISNYAAWEVAEIVQICRANGYIQPSVYQGIYNAVHRLVEPELFPCMRKYGISFYAYNPLGGGFLTGRYTSSDDIPEEGSRFSAGSSQGQFYRRRYWKEPYFKAINSIRAVAEKHGLTLAEIALRWMSYHSLMKCEFGDSVLIDASSLDHIEQNLLDLGKGPLPEEVVQALDAAWIDVQPYATKYYH